MAQKTITIQKLMNEIDFPKSLKNTINTNFSNFDIDELRDCAIKLLDSKEASQEAKHLTKLYQQDFLKELTIHLYAASLTWEKIYAPLGISYKVYIDTMRAFTRFLEESKKINLRYKFDRGFWTWRYLSGLEFRINELEFEMVAAPHKNKVPQLEEKNYISIHIPSDASLAHPIISKNYLEAKIFFKTFIPDYYAVPFVTDTWLLSPKLKDWLEPESNLLLFANDYQLLLTQPNKDEGVF